MGNKTAIGWTHRTMNPIRVKDSKTFHCVKRSPACDNCYAEVMAKRLAGMGHTKFYPYKVHREMPELELDRKMLASWKKTKKPYLNFVTSMTDLFGEFVPPVWIFEVLDAMIAAPRQVFQVLTKREDIMLSVIDQYCQRKSIDRLPENIWMGVTVESQKWYDKRIDSLLKARVSVRWLSMEPLLGPVDLHLSGTLPKDFFGGGFTGYLNVGCLIHWVVVGGESAPHKKCRPTHPEWFNSIWWQCMEHNIPFFFKQWGNWSPIDRGPKKGDKGHYAYGWEESEYEGKPTDMPNFIRPESLPGLIAYTSMDPQWMKYMSKKQAGELLDGVEYKEFPAIAERLLEVDQL